MHRIVIDISADTEGGVRIPFTASAKAKIAGAIGYDFDWGRSHVSGETTKVTLDLPGPGAKPDIPANCPEKKNCYCVYKKKILALVKYKGKWLSEHFETDGVHTDPILFATVEASKGCPECPKERPTTRGENSQ